MSHPVFLTGMMGAGKSTVGCEVAAELGVPMIDLDRRIERIFGSTVAAMFEGGESHFRELEHAALVGLIAEPGFRGRGVVVATGGGVVLDPRNVEAMNGAGTTILLEISPERAAERLAGTSDRPLLGGGESLEGRLQEIWVRRRDAYRTATHVVDAALAARIVAHRVVQLLRETGTR